MKMNAALVERTVSQLDARAIPEDDPLVPELNSRFGDHTFFLDANGLNIVEPAGTAPSGTPAGKVINLANWNNANRTSLTPHEPQTTDTIVELGSAGAKPKA
jgi:hypothetical protein